MSLEKTELKHQTVIDAEKRSPIMQYAELWRYRELVWVMIVRDLKVRYKQTVMGVAWAVLQPLTMIMIFTIIFSRLAKIPSEGYPYPVFVFSGLLAWSFFATSVTTGGVSLISANHLVTKVYFPRIIIPLSSLGVSLVDFAIGASLLVIMMLFYDVPLSSNLLFLPFFLIGLIAFTIGFSSWLAAVTVVYRDFRYVITYMLQIWMYVTPVIYPATFVPEKWRFLIYFNPMYAWIDGVRACFLNRPVDWVGTSISLSITVAMFIVGMYYFDKTQQRFADII